MALHEVQLKGYSVRPGNLSLGTFGSYGIEQRNTVTGKHPSHQGT